MHKPLPVFQYQQSELYAEGVSLASIARTHGTPTYVYSRAAITAHYHAYSEALVGCDHQICYAVKANANLAVLNVLARLGAGFDIVSIGELERVLRAGGEASRVVFSGVGKQAYEIERALQVGIACFNVESRAELQRIQKIAEGMNVIAAVSLRVNPDVDANTHPYISTGLRENKFGIDMDEALDVYREAQAFSHITVRGIDCHIGSQLTTLDPFLDALKRVLSLVDELAAEGIVIHHLDLGGGLGVAYRPDEVVPTPGEYIKAIRAQLGTRPQKIFIEPGRSIVANAGVLLTRVDLLKSTPARHFAVVDAAMNDLIRPALYQAWQFIEPVKKPNDAISKPSVYDIVGPVCETGDFLGKERELTLAPDDLLAIHGSGAYGFVMSSNYNSRTRAAEIMVDGEQVFTVRARETLEDLWSGESLLP